MVMCGVQSSNVLERNKSFSKQFLYSHFSGEKKQNSFFVIFQKKKQKGFLLFEFHQRNLWPRGINLRAAEQIAQGLHLLGDPLVHEFLYMEISNDSNGIS